jgi:ABC-type dipeptide/oligopeptide/nickel transport system permease component
VTAELRLASLRAFGSLLLTSLLVVWLADVALANARLNDLTIGVLLRGIDPYRDMTTVEALATSLGRSAALLAVALVAAVAVGLAAGAGYALSAARPIRAVSWGIGTVGVSLPSFFWAMLLQLVVVLVFVRTQTRILPTSGFGMDEHLILPALALAARPTAYVFRTTATALEQVRHGDYVRTAHGKGLLASVVARRHILPNAAPAMVTGFGLAARTALSSLAIIEYVFSWHGAGFGFIHGLANGNTTFATLIALSFALVFAALAVAVDAVARAFVPRRA